MLWRSREGRGRVPGEPNAQDLMGEWQEVGTQGQGGASLREGELSLAGDTRKVRGVLGAVSIVAWS